jgi:hypothetical protein
MRVQHVSCVRMHAMACAHVHLVVMRGGASEVVGSLVDDSVGHNGSMVVLGVDNSGSAAPSSTPSSDQPCAAQWCTSNNVLATSVHCPDTIAYADDHNMPRCMNSCNTSEVQDAFISNRALR